MASPLTVKVHPVVYMIMVDSFERRVQKAGVNNRALGTLLGFYEKNVVQVTNCYAISFREGVNAGDLPEINDVFNQEMWQVSKRAAPSEQIVGWFFTVSERELPLSSVHFHSYYTNLMSEISVKKELPPVILLAMDVSFSGESRFPVRAYIRAEAGVPGKATQATIFQPLKVRLDAFAGEDTALGFIMKGVDSERREIELDIGLNQLENSTGKMVDWLESHLKYVNEVLASGKFPADATIGRKLMEVVDQAATQLSSGKLEKLVKNSLRDYMMVSYLANLTKTQLAIQEKVVC